MEMAVCKFGQMLLSPNFPPKITAN